jgi:D-lyxose ketol-isomerase
VVREVRAEAREMIRRSGVCLADSELDTMTIIDFGLGDLRREGVQYVDILLSEALRTTVLVLLPNQTLPQHLHPPYDGCPGKEETVRAVTGEFRLYTSGPDTMSVGFLVEGKERYYTARHEHVLHPAQSLTVDPGVPHWFQAGPEGSVSYGFYNRVDESRNIFSDPDVSAICGAGSGTLSSADDSIAHI